ncbi:MAG: DUF3006 domain-containing protein [Patescibacteria group bacterium]|jgi:hypothetical protein
MEINLTIDRFEEDKAALKTEDGQETIIFPKNLLPADAHEGAVLSFSIRALAEAEEEKRKKAKDILNEILNIGDNNG